MAPTFRRKPRSRRRPCRRRKVPELPEVPEQFAPELYREDLKNRKKTGYTYRQRRRQHQPPLYLNPTRQSYDFSPAYYQCYVSINSLFTGCVVGFTVNPEPNNDFRPQAEKPFSVLSDFSELSNLFQPNLYIRRHINSDSPHVRPSPIRGS